MMPLVDTFRALADPTRLRIVALLRSMELSVGELAQVLGQSQPRVSRHIGLLCDAGLATRRREGSWVFLAPAASAVMTSLYTLIDDAEAGGGDGVREADAARLQAVRADRATAAAQYFVEHARQWDAIRSLHVADAEVEATMRALLGDHLGRLVDVGTGTGRMLELFGGAADVATGVDRSPEMLRLARAKLVEAGRPGDLRQGDIAALPLADASADTVIVHQVLHYLQAPDAALRECARIVAPGGRLLVVDFDAHDREELRSAHAHARLGFTDAQIAHWLDAAGLALSASETLEGGALTVKLWLATRPGERRALAA